MAKLIIPLVGVGLFTSGTAARPLLPFGRGAFLPDGVEAFPLPGVLPFVGVDRLVAGGAIIPDVLLTMGVLVPVGVGGPRIGKLVPVGLIPFGPGGLLIPLVLGTPPPLLVIKKIFLPQNRKS